MVFPLWSRILSNSAAKFALVILFFCQFSAASGTSCLKFYTPSLTVPERQHLAKPIQDAFDIVKKDWLEEARVEGLGPLIESDSSGSMNRVALFKKLGFEWSRDGEVKVADTFDFIVRYHQKVHSDGYGHKKYLRPALVFVKYRDPSETEVVEIKLIDPLKKGVSIPSGFVPLKRRSETFNLPYAVIMSGLKDGLFPLLGGMHDVAHFLGLSMQPEIGVAIVDAINRLPEGKRTRQFGRRIILLLEYSAFIPAKFKNPIRAALLLSGIVEVRTRESIQQDLMMLPLEQLIQRAQRSADLLDKSLVDFGGATTGSWERIQDTNRMFKISNYDLKRISFKQLLAYQQVMFKKPENRVAEGFVGELETRFREDRYEQIIRAYPRFFLILVRELASKLTAENKEDLGWAFDLPSLRALELVHDKEKMKLIRGNMEPRIFPEPTEKGENFLKTMLAEATSAVEFQLAQAAYGLNSVEIVQAMLKPTLTETDALGKYFQQLYPGFIEMLGVLDKN